MKKYNKFPFNHFILWCRGWYDWEEELSIYHKAQRTFELDGYLPKNDAYRLSIIALEEICEYLNCKFKVSEFLRYLKEYENKYSEDIAISIATEIATISAVKSYLRFIDIQNAEHKLVIAKEGLKGLKYNTDEESINRVFGEERDEPKLYDDF